MKKLTVVPNSTETLVGFIYLAIQLLVLQPVLMLINLMLPVPMTEAMLNFVYFGVNFLFVVVIFHRFLLNSGKLAIVAPFLCLRAAFLGMVAYWVGSLLVSTVIFSVYPEFINVNDSSISQMTQNNYGMMTLGTVLLVPITEEVLFRGLVFGKLYNRSRFVAYTVSTLVFAALHVIGYIGMYEPVHLLLCLLQYIPAGLCLGWTYARGNTIWAPILVHITINQVAMLSMR